MFTFTTNNKHYSKLYFFKSIFALLLSSQYEIKIYFFQFLIPIHTFTAHYLIFSHYFFQFKTLLKLYDDRSHLLDGINSSQVTAKRIEKERNEKKNKTTTTYHTAESNEIHCYFMSIHTFANTHTPIWTECSAQCALCLSQVDFDQQSEWIWIGEWSGMGQRTRARQRGREKETDRVHTRWCEHKTTSNLFQKRGKRQTAATAAPNIQKQTQWKHDRTQFTIHRSLWSLTHQHQRDSV